MNFTPAARRAVLIAVALTLAGLAVKAEAATCDETCSVIKTMLIARSNSFKNYRGGLIDDEAGEWFSTLSVPGALDSKGAAGPCEINNGTDIKHTVWRCRLGKASGPNWAASLDPILKQIRAAVPAGWTEGPLLKNMKTFSAPGDDMGAVAVSYFENRDQTRTITLSVFVTDGLRKSRGN